MNQEVFRPEDAYKGSDRPIMVARKKCGCYVAALVIDNMDRIEEIDDFRKECDEWGATLEVRPVRFVHNGGLSFDCKHKDGVAANVERY